MRVTFNTFPNALVDQLGKLVSRQTKLQEQASTGQRVQLPEDDPVAMRRALELQANGAATAQYQQNIGALKDQANASYEAMRALKKISDRASELATLADGTKSPSDLAAYAAEVTQLIQQAVQLANQKYNGNYLFAGTSGDQPPFALSTDNAGLVSSVTYQGNSSTLEVEIGEGTTAASQIPGANTTGSGPRGLITDSRSGADFFNHLIQLQNHLTAGDTGQIAATDQPQLAKDEDNLLYNFASLGAVLQRLDATSEATTKHAEALQSTLSTTVDADLPDTLVQLNQTQTAYQAALQSAARILNQSLLDYIS